MQTIAVTGGSGKAGRATIAELLAADGAKVARRTVAKYREAMRIAPSSERRAALGR